MRPVEKPKLGFTLLVFYAIMIWYGWFLPRDQINAPESTQVVEEPYHTVEDTLVIDERPSWVYPLIIGHSVTVTVYHAVEAQCDDSPDVLADGTRIDVTKAGSYRYCALSRNLLERWNGPYAYGDTIFLEGAGKFSGPWVVKDTMNKRFIDRMDLLVDVGTKSYKFDVATIRKGMNRWLVGEH
jgi:hypothetical protein